jgi:glucosamine kinase
MIIVADSGSTKTDWCVLSRVGAHTHFSTAGINPFFMEESDLLPTIRTLIAPHVDETQVTKLFFYGAGCQGSKIAVMEGVFKQIFPSAVSIQVHVDLLAAARALLGDTPGFAAILGTGTNTCLYDGNDISYHIDSLGFFLGDEGSGSAIGKRVLVDFLRNRLPRELHSAFIREYGGNEAEIIDLLYKSPQPNRFCAGFARFLDIPDMNQAYLHDVVGSSFRTFFSHLVCSYPDYRTFSFNCVGSIAHRFVAILKEEATYHGMTMGRILPSVIEELATYHSSKL